MSIAALFIATLLVTDLKAQPSTNSSEPRQRSRSADKADNTDLYAELRKSYFHQLDELVAEHDAYVANHAAETAIESTDRLLSRMLNDVPMVYLRDYLVQESPGAAADTKARRERVLERIEHLREIDFDAEALDLARIGPPPQKMRGDEHETGFAARRMAARREAVNHRVDAVERCEQWLDESKRRDRDSRE